MATIMTRGTQAERSHYFISGHSTKDRMIARLEDMMGEAKNDYEMNMIRNAISQIQSSN